MADRDKLILDLRTQGEKLKTIGEKFGITRERVRQILAKQPSLPKGKNHLQIRLHKAIDGLDLSRVDVIREIREKTGDHFYITPSYIKSVTGVDVPRNPNYLQEQIDRYRDYEKRGLTTGEVAKLEGIHQPSVSRITKRLGLKLKDGRRSSKET